MQWAHNVSASWLKARRKYLTASEVAGLVPAYKRVVKKLSTKQLSQEQDKDIIKILKDFIALYISKSSSEEIITASPSSAAARGHILEPYAVEEFNNKVTDNVSMVHWDDALIWRDGLPMGIIPGKDIYDNYKLAFSPDALTIPQKKVKNLCEYRIEVGPNRKANTKYSLGEIKSYNIEKHAKKILSDNKECEERYQIATAMIVDDLITDGYLILYNPNSVTPIAWKHYDRDELKDEMEICRGIWILFNLGIEIYHKIHPKDKPLITEKEIHDKYMEKKYIKTKYVEGINKY